MRDPDSVGPYRVIPFLPERNATLDTLRWAKRRLQIPVLLEIDVTSARKAIRSFRSRTGQGLSFTAWVVTCVARAAAEHPRVHAVRQGRRRLVVFGEVDVAHHVTVGDEAPAEARSSALRFHVRRSPGGLDAGVVPLPDHHHSGPDTEPQLPDHGEERDPCLLQRRHPLPGQDDETSYVLVPMPI